MPIESPQLDDLRFATVVDQLRRQIPAFTPEWTDHNESDPGVTLLQLFGYLTEQIGFRLNRLPDKAYVEMLKLIGVRLRPAEPARTYLAFYLAKAEKAVGFEIREGTRVAAKSKAQPPPKFETTATIDAVPAQLVTLVTTRSDDLTKLTLAETAAETAALGDQVPPRLSLAWDGRQPKLKDWPETPARLWARPSEDVHRTLWLGLAFNPLPSAGFIGQRVTLTVQLDDDELPDARAFADCNLDAELLAEAIALTIEITYYRPAQPGSSVGSWQPLRVIGDSSNGFTRSGQLRFDVPLTMGPVPDGEWQNLGTKPHPLIGAIKTPVQGSPSLVPVSGWIGLHFPDQPARLAVRALSFNAAPAIAAITAANELLGRGSNRSDQVVKLGHANVLADSLALIVEDVPRAEYQTWTRVENFDTAGPEDRAFVLDAEAGLIYFGDGVRGRVPGLDARIVAVRYRHGGGAASEVGLNTVTLGENVPVAVADVTNPVAARGGRDAETLDEAKRRAPRELRTMGRAVTADDYAFLATQAPGVRVARTVVIPLRRPYTAEGQARPGVDVARAAPGALSVVIVPDGTGPYLAPTESMLRTVCRHLDRYRLVTTELYVVAPQYVRISDLTVTVLPLPGYTRTQLRKAIAARLEAYLHVLNGGPDGTGYPFGGTLYQAELVAQVFRVEGVDRVEDLTARYQGDDPNAVPPMAWRDERQVARNLVACPSGPLDDERVELFPDETVFFDPTSLNVIIPGMSSIFSDGALHPGRDPNDAWWIVVRRPDDWGVDPKPDATCYDPSRMVLELAPLPFVAGGGAAPSVIGADGTRYTLDPDHDRVLVQLPCDLEPQPLAGVGGAGGEVGRLARPVAIAIDERGWLYVAEAGNHRVSVIDPAGPGDARVVITLGAVDGWGRPIAGDAPAALRDPVAVAVGGGRIYVGQRAGWVQTYDRQFRVGVRFEARRPGAAPGELYGLAAVDGGLVVIASAGWSQLLRFTCDGDFHDELGWGDAPPALADLSALAQYQLEGTRIVGPIDGGHDGLAWHQIVVDAELPPGTAVEIQTWIADAIAAPPPVLATPPTLPELRLPPEVTPWAPDAAVALPTSDEPRHGVIARLVHSDVATWTRWRGGPYRRGASWSLAGTGPIASASFTATLADARRLRVGDQVELTRAGLPPVPTTIATMTDTTLAAIASGPRLGYGPGTTVVLRERGGRALDEPLLATLVPGESFNLAGILIDGGGGDVVVPHRIAALLRRDDLIKLSAGGPPALVKIDGIDPAPVVITLAVAAAADYREATLRLVITVDGRLVCEPAEEWGDGFPPNSAIEVGRTSTAIPDTLRVTWSEPDTATVWTATAPAADWITLAVGDKPIATDRGRYLWIKVRLRGARRHPADVAAFSTPTVRSLRAVAPRLSYLGYLPAVFGRRDADTPTGATYLERFLALFEGRLTRVEERFELVARLLNPFAADDDWLAFVASWFALVLDPTWPRPRRAALLTQIVELYRLRGTRAGLVRTIEAFTGHRPELIEGFQVRPRAGMILGCAGVLGCAPLGGLDLDAAATEQLVAAYAHRLELVAFVDDDCELAAASTALFALIDAIKPAHVDVDLRVTTRASRIGMESRIGLDFVLAPDRSRRAPLGATDARGAVAPVLGVDATLTSRPRAHGAALAESGPPSIGELTLR